MAQCSSCEYEATVGDRCAQCAVRTDLPARVDHTLRWRVEYALGAMAVAVALLILGAMAEWGSPLATYATAAGAAVIWIGFYASRPGATRGLVSGGILAVTLATGVSCSVKQCGVRLPGVGSATAEPVSR